MASVAESPEIAKTSTMQANISIDWPCNDVVQGGAAVEFAIRSVLVRKKEYDIRGKDLPKHRLMEITDACSPHGMRLPQALSLRRSLLRQKLGPHFFQRKSFGSEEIVEMATLFEKTVEEFLRKKEVVYITEAEQKTASKKGIFTPDFLIPPHIHLAINGHVVKWLDCKVGYGAAMFNNITTSQKKWVPVAKLSDIAKNYTMAYGPGTFVMSQGYNIELQNMLSTNFGTFLLDSTPLDMSDMDALA
jgi:hypothetical protein